MISCIFEQRIIMKKNIIITGASRGIGFALAKKHLELNNNVLVVSRNENAMKPLWKYVDNSDFSIKKLDLSDYASIEQIVGTISNWSRVDVLYNNAGYLVHKPFGELTQNELEQSIAVNFKAPFRMIQLVEHKMDARSHIVNITTMGAVQGTVKFPGLAAYSSSKAGIITLTELLAEEFTEDQARINCVALGAVETEMLKEAFPGYKAPISAEKIADYLAEFGLRGHHFQNGKIIQLSMTTP